MHSSSQDRPAVPRIYSEPVKINLPGTCISCSRAHPSIPRRSTASLAARIPLGILCAMILDYVQTLLCNCDDNDPRIACTSKQGCFSWQPVAFLATRLWLRLHIIGHITGHTTYYFPGCGWNVFRR